MEQNYVAIYTRNAGLWGTPDEDEKNGNLVNSEYDTRHECINFLKEAYKTEIPTCFWNPQIYNKSAHVYEHVGNEVWG